MGCINFEVGQRWKVRRHTQENRVQLLTTAEAADYLRLKERKLYELVAEGAIPCTKVTGRWLFPKAELDQWLSSSLVRPDGVVLADPPPIVGGSHDPLLEWVLRESASGLATLTEGSEAGLRRFAEGGVIAAAIHLHAMDSEKSDANVEALRARSDLRDAVLIGFLCREQGLLVAPGNPLQIRTVEEAVRAKARVTVRPAGAGAQLLLLALLHRAEIRFEKIMVAGPPSPTGPDVAQAIRAGRADCGIATRSVANAAGLDFVPLLWERFDLVMRNRDYFRPPLQRLLNFLRAPEFAARAKELGGYDVSGAGAVRHAP
jgi:putative molybdopterin biosynthesis protein